MGAGGDLDPSTWFGNSGDHWYNWALDPIGKGAKSAGQALQGPPPGTTNQINANQYNGQGANIQGQLAGRSPFASGDWGDVINQLKQRANGQNSLAAQEYQQASQNTAGQLAGMAHGGANPAAFRAAAEQQGQIGQGMAQGTAMAQTQEQMAAQQQLQGALGTRDQLNQGAYQGLMNNQGQLNQQQLQAELANQQGYYNQQGLNNDKMKNFFSAESGVLGGAAKMGG